MDRAVAVAVVADGAVKEMIAENTIECFDFGSCMCRRSEWLYVITNVGSNSVSLTSRSILLVAAAEN